MSELTEHTVQLGGFDHTVQLNEADAERLTVLDPTGDAPTPGDVPIEEPADDADAPTGTAPAE